MSDLLVDTTLLRDMASDVSLIRTEFDTAKTTSQNLADAVGHAGLADRVTAFASNWDHRRSEPACIVWLRGYGQRGCVGSR
ncbi:hypothetical protein SAMN05216368_11218 [Cryobacterium flavum]|uniref:Uncharacterized protein n=1 Tax=Cryobacterium flavum TaxID=1424659 RepID=A0A4V3I822_9MICO|nr:MULTISPECIES: hypothetical protein [Cryobacterium]TFB72040.1 hypothetical protein E3O21_19600 [Cryobacterium flavum]SDO18678.1 hypothetical protein SAMN05216368_11218 [Cryobacterium flavum]